MRARGLRPPWAGTVVMIDLRLPTGPLTTSTTRLSPPSPPPCPPPFRPSVRHRIDREVARPAGRSVDAAPSAPPASVGRNVYHAAADCIRTPLFSLAFSLAFPLPARMQRGEAVVRCDPPKCVPHLWRVPSPPRQRCYCVTSNGFKRRRGGTVTGRNQQSTG